MKNIVIMGLGRTGFSCVKYFQESGATVAVTDSRAHPPAEQELAARYPHVQASLGQFDSQMMLQADTLVISPGISVNHPLVQQALQKGIEVIGDVELFARQVKAPVAGITGTNGKSTVTALVAAMLQAAGRMTYAGGNFGTPVLELLEQPQPDAYVLELSSFQLQSTHSLKVKAAAILNLTPDHLDWHKDMEEYLQAKRRIYRHCDTAVYYADDERLWPPATVCNRVSFSVQHATADYCVAGANGNSVLMARDTEIVKTSELKIAGKHNWENALAAAALAQAMGIEMEPIRTALRAFGGLEHRCQWVAEKNGITWYNDSKGTNVGATVAALNGFSAREGKVLLIAGGLGKGQSFAALRDPVLHMARAVILFGVDAGKIQSALTGTTLLIRAGDLHEAVQAANRWAQAGDAVLFSPACASFDMFENYRHRGDVFVKAVKDILHEH